MLYKLIYYLSILSPLPAIIIAGRRRSVLWYYVLMSFLSDITSYILGIYKLPHAVVSNTFMLAEFVLLTAYFKRALLGDKYRNQYIAIVGLLSLWFIINSFSRINDSASDADGMNYFFTSFFYILYLLLSLFSFYKIMKSERLVNLAHSSLFIISVAILLYASGSYMLFLFKPYLERINLEMMRRFWFYLFLPLNILKNILIAIALYNDRRFAQ